MGKVVRAGGAEGGRRGGATGEERERAEGIDSHVHSSSVSRVSSHVAFCCFSYIQLRFLFLHGLELLELQNNDFTNVWSFWSSKTMILLTFGASGAPKP